MSETELSVICKNCGSEVSPYVTECPYCGARLRKRAPKLERRGDAIEALQPRRRRRRIPRLGGAGFPLSAERPYATLAVILGSAILLLVQKATGYALGSFGGLVIPIQEEWWRYFTAPFAYVDVGFLFVVSLALAIFSTGVERRLGTVRTAILLLACGVLGMIAADAVAGSTFTVIAGGNGMALGAIAAWFVIRRAEVSGEVGEDFDVIGVAVCAAVVILLPLFAPTADWMAGLAGGAIGALAGFAATFHRAE
jgi:membrane associated rhomboid family serine protease